MITRNVDLIGAAQGWGTKESGCEDGPATLQKSYPSLVGRGFEASWGQMLKTPNTAQIEKLPTEGFDAVVDMSNRLAIATAESLGAGNTPCVIGGDHSIALGTWSGVTTHLKAEGEFGLIWVDAHMDAHTPETRHEGKWGGYYHGQVLACLLGVGDGELPKIASDKVKLNPRHVTMIGCRSFEPGEEAFLLNLGVKIFYQKDVAESGFGHAFKIAIDRARNGTKGFGLTVDLDAFDPAFAPGVGTIEEDGLDPDEVLPCLHGLADTDGFSTLEVVEYNPHNDPDGRTAELATQIIQATMERHR